MSDEYAHDVGRKLCLQLCSLAGYGSVNDSALDVLADVAKHFLKQTSTVARSYAENAGRTDINAQDIVMGLDDMGFSLEDLKEFESSTAEVPFGVTVPKFPVQPQKEDYVSFKQEKQNPPEHVPNYLPVFPAEHTYRETALYVNKQQDEKTRAVHAHEVKRTTEDVLIKLGNKEDQDNPYLSTLFDKRPEMPQEEKGHMHKKQRKTASNWSKYLLGRVQQSEESATLASGFVPPAASLPAFDSKDVTLRTKKRKKDKREPQLQTGKPMQTPFASVVKFNLQPTPPPSTVDLTLADSPAVNPSIATEDLSISQVLEPPPTAQGEGSVAATEDLDIFGSAPFPVILEETDSNDFLGDGSSIPGETQTETQVPEEIEERPDPSPQSKSDT